MPVLAWMTLIFIASTDLGSAEHTSRYLVPFLHWLRPGISVATIANVQFFIRKAAHLTEYAVLAILLLRALRGQTSGTIVKQAALVLIVAAIYAATDEFHQSFAPSRTPSARDVLIDSTGAAVGLLIYLAAARRRLAVEPQPATTRS